MPSVSPSGLSVDAPQTGECLRLDDPVRLNAELAAVLREAGKATFHARMARFVADIADCRKWLVMRYSVYDKPVFVANNAMSDEACAMYLGGLHRFDPLQRLASDRTPARVVNIKALESLETDEEYLTEIYRHAFIFDELAALLPAPGGVTFAVCCEREEHRFTEDDVAAIQSLLPLLEAMHQVHLERTFSKLVSEGDSPARPEQRDAIQVLDRAGNRIFTTAQWRALEQDLSTLGELADRASREPPGQIDVAADRVLHWESLGADFALAPGGLIMTVEQCQADPTRRTAGEAVRAFQKTHDLTPREVDIVKLVLIGFPNERIADQLGISVGTVKNHRWRLYYKLDITSERELFHLFLATVIDVSAEEFTAEAGDASEALVQ